MGVPALVLAAGASTRLGMPKQLVKVEGEAMLHRTARIALEAGCGPVLAVLGCAAGLMERVLRDLPVCIVMNPDWPEGMASSIRAGVGALPGGADAVLLLLCDQTALDVELIRRMLAAHAASPEATVACAYGGTLGVPALFPGERFAELMKLQGDRGAKALLREGDLVEIAFPGGEADLDGPEDMERLR